MNWELQGGNKEEELIGDIGLWGYVRGVRIVIIRDYDKIQKRQ